MKQHKKILIFLGILAILSPLGLMLPEYFKAGSAWGEWSVSEVKEQTGIEPEGMKKDTEKFTAPLPDYSNGKENSLHKNSMYYIFSGILGSVIIMGVSFGIMKLISKKRE